MRSQGVEKHVKVQGDLIDAIRTGKVREIIPSIDYDRGVDYCSSIRNIIEDCSYVEEYLETLVELGVLRKDLAEEIPVCSNCGSHRLLIRLTCPSCASTLLSKENFIEHLTCGYSGPEKEFRGKSGEMRCPECGRGLRALGVDYRRISNAYQCQKMRKHVCQAKDPLHMRRLW